MKIFDDKAKTVIKVTIWKTRPHPGVSLLQNVVLYLTIYHKVLPLLICKLISKPSLNSPPPPPRILELIYQFQGLPEGMELPHACKRRKCQQTHAPASATEARTQRCGININCFMVKMRTACIESSLSKLGSLVKLPTWNWRKWKEMKKVP